MGVGAGLYVNSLHNNFVDDDSGQIVFNNNINSFKAAIERPIGYYYRPLMFLYFNLIHRLAGLDPLWYRLPQICLFIASVWLVYFLLKKFIDKRLALCLSLVFLVHSMNVDTVAYISHIQDVLFGFFGLLALFIVEKWRKKPAWLLAASLALLMFLAGLAKETGMIFVPIVILYSSWFKRERFKTVAIGSAAGAAAYALFYFLAPKFAFPPPIGQIGDLDFWHRLMSAPAILWFYVHTLFYPKTLSIGYGWTVRHFSWTDFWGPLIAVLLFCSLLVAGGWRVAKKRPENLKVYIFFAIWLVISMGPNLQIFPLESTVAERWFYMPMVSLLAMFGLGLATFEWRKIKPVLRSLVTAVFILALAGLAFRSYDRIRNFHDNITLLRHDSAERPQDYRLDNELGEILAANNRQDEAVPYYLESLNLEKNHNDAWNDMGLVYVYQDNLAMAERYFINSTHYDSNFLNGYVNLATVYMLESRPDLAKQTTLEGLKRFPDERNLKLRLSEANKALEAPSN